MINYHPQTLLYQQLVDWSNPYHKSIADNELIVDKVVLISKETYAVHNADQYTYAGIHVFWF
jgi:hypothetical protein